MLTIKKIDSYKDFLLLKEDWNTLLSNSNHDTIFLRHEWFSAWWQSFGNQKKLFILLVEENGSLVGIAPLMLLSEKFRGLPVRCIKFIENDESPRIDFIIMRNKTNVLPFLIEFLESIHKEWDVIVLKSILEKSDTLEYVFNKIGSNHLLFRSKNSWASPVLHPTMDWNTFLSKKAKLFRKRIRRFRNKIQRLGNVDIKKITETSLSLQEMSNVWQVGQKSWKHHINKAISSTEQRRKFFSLLTQIAGQEGWLNLWLLLVNDKPIAFEYHLKYKNKIHGIRSEFDEQYKSYSPGFVLDTYIVESIFNNSVFQYDMGGTDDFYKLQWTSDVQEHKEVFIFNSHIYSRLLFTIEFIFIQKLLKLFRSFKRFYKNQKDSITLNFGQAIDNEDNLNE